jgi:hypothetical protein
MGKMGTPSCNHRETYSGSGCLLLWVIRGLLLNFLLRGKILSKRGMGLDLSYSFWYFFSGGCARYKIESCALLKTPRAFLIKKRRRGHVKRIH